MDETNAVYTIEREKPPFKRVGWTFFAILSITTLLQIIGAAVAYAFAPNITHAPWFVWALSFAPLYLIAIPLGYIIIRPLPKLKVPQQSIGFKKFLAYLAMSYAIMYVGNIIGTMLNGGIAQLRGQELINPLEQLLTGSNIYFELVFVGLLAPVFEELVFRKLLLDRIRAYGEGTAILVSGLCFGLFHGNLFQFFYAFGLGALFAYIYLRTGRVRYTIILHAIINSFSVLLSVLMGSIDLEALQNFSGEDPNELINALQGNLAQYAVFGLCMLAIMTLFVWGIVLLITKRKSAVLFTAPNELPKKGRFKTVFVSWGMALFMLLSLGLMTYSALA
ncbi:MAG: CPBP family intramembrane metalloprotease [Clostridia bacterium]|nr:CPBP family intramembrane metalloprotease [Clostridia bacterium]